MSHIASCLILELDSQVDNAHTLLHMCSGHIAHPARDSGREQKDLKITGAHAPALCQDLSQLNKHWLGTEILSRCLWLRSTHHNQKSLTLSTSSLKPCLSIWSASSRTTVFRAEKSMFPRSMWSRTRPHVPTKKSTPCLSDLVWSSMLTPP